MLEVRKDARNDLRSISDYIAQDNPARAIEYIEELLERIDWIAKNPRLYPVRLQWRTGLRIANYGRYQILYRVDGNSVVILRIVHSSRDMANIVDDLE